MLIHPWVIDMDLQNRPVSILIATFAAIAALCAGGLASAHDYPKIMNVFTNEVEPEHCEPLSRWDVLCLSTCVQDFTPELIGQIRALNPEIKILAYFPAAFVGGRLDSMYPTRQGCTDKVVACDWWLYDTKGHHIGHEGSLWFTNLTPHCPEDQSGRVFAEWLADYISDEIIATGLWDGVLIDGLFENPNWISNHEHFFADPPAMIDANRDGVGDNADSLYAWWRGSVELFLSTLRQRIGPAYILQGNDKNYMSEYLNGGIREDFPYMHGDWEDNMFSDYGYVTMSRDWLQTPMGCTVMLCWEKSEENTLWEPVRTAAYERFLRFCLTSSLLGDGYLYFGVRTGALWWEDYYDLDVGLPTGDAYMDSVWNPIYNQYRSIWKREFEHATVVCNPYIQWFTQPDGTWLAPQDGRIKMHSIPHDLGFSLDKSNLGRTFSDVEESIEYDITVTNPGEHSAYVGTWARLTSGSDTVHAGGQRTFLIPAGKTDTLSLGLYRLEQVGIGTYSLEVFVGTMDQVPVLHDTAAVRRIIDFEKQRFLDADGSGEGSLLVYPQPVPSTGGSVSMEVRSGKSDGRTCSVRIFDIRGRLVGTVYEGELKDGLSFDFDLTGQGGEMLAPGIYFVSLEAGDSHLKKKIVLLR
jgi:hypothetical protein